MKTTLILFLMATILMANSCDKNDCKGEPESINFNEQVKLKLVDQNGESIFSSMYSLDSLLVKENGNELNFEINSKDTSLSFPISINTLDYIKQFWNQTISTRISIYLSDSEIDTTTIELTPVIYPEKCNAMEYQTMVIHYNNNELKKENNTSCITCNTPLIIIKQ